ncbi:hypothetical protein GE061_005620 [Apolygus lucorum]|uniref:Uncharacterized protein n=1 Tax=Apolygus lucorum TaxID=248454 RepID=A0A8S9WWW0_APOLU|nr:hypothetical protein GE061_005620 [Apolygus lucorum]
MATSRILVESEKALNKSDQESVGYSEERKTDVGLGDIPMAIEDNSSTTDNSTTISGDYGNITGDFQNQTADFKSQFEAAGNQTEYYKNRTEDFRNHTEVRNARLSNPNFSDVGTFSVEPLDLIPIVVNVSVVVQDMTNVENQNVMGKIVAKGGAHATQLIENSSSLSVMTDNSSKEQNQVSSAAAKIRKKDANKTKAVQSPNATREPIMVINLEPAIPPEKTKNSSRLTSEETMQKHIHLERTEQTFDVMTGAEVVITFAPDTTKKVAAARKVSSSSARMFLIDMKTFLVLFFVYSKLMSFRLN